jgi:hypothetical protein
MRWLRFLNPVRHLRLERERDKLVIQRAGTQRGVRSLVESIGRATTPADITGLHARILFLETRNNAHLICMGLAKIELERGRPDQARHLIETMLDAPALEQREAS